jgi:hypothetical protein
MKYAQENIHFWFNASLNFLTPVENQRASFDEYSACY